MTASSDLLTVPLDRMAQKSAENLVNGVKKSTTIPFESVLYALGIRYVGETVAKKLAKHYKNIDALSRATLMDLVLVDEIGERIARSVVDFFENEENKIIIADNGKGMSLDDLKDKWLFVAYSAKNEGVEDE